MTDFIQAYSDEIEAALAEQGAAIAAAAVAVDAARERFAFRAHDAEVTLLTAMAHRGQMYVAGGAAATATYGQCQQASLQADEIAPPSDETEGRAEEASR